MIRYKSTAYIYWYFCHEGDRVLLDRQNPIIPSIATLRHFSKLPIYVLDVSQEENDWEHWPKQFDFQVIKSRFSFDFLPIEDGLGPHSRELLSKNNDCHQFAMELKENHLCVVDADIFWLESVDKDFRGGFCIDSLESPNSGLYAYDKDHPFIDIWRGMNHLCLIDYNFRKSVIENHGSTDHAQEEMILRYLIHSVGANGLTEVGHDYNFLTYFYRRNYVGYDSMKTIHLLSSDCPDKDALKVAGQIKETRDVLEKMFDARHLNQMFDPRVDISVRDREGMLTLLEPEIRFED